MSSPGKRYESVPYSYVVNGIIDLIKMSYSFPREGLTRMNNLLETCRTTFWLILALSMFYEPDPIAKILFYKFYKKNHQHTYGGQRGSCDGSRCGLPTDEHLKQQNHIEDIGKILALDGILQHVVGPCQK